MPKLLFIGDIVGRPGRDIAVRQAPRLRVDRGLTFVVANGENAAAGSGITSALARSILGGGIDAITLGDHIWDQRGWESEIASFDRVCRPANLPASCPGRDHVIVESDGFRLAVFTVLGRQYINLKADCPFLAADRMIASLKDRAHAIVVEIHAEATSEKQALGWYLDGRVAAVLGSHTHVATADASLLPKSTAYLSDLGMTGPYASVLGREVAPVIAKFLDGMPRRFEVATGDTRLSGAVIDLEGPHATRIELVSIRDNWV